MKEDIPFLDVQDSGYWLVDENSKSETQFVPTDASPASTATISQTPVIETENGKTVPEMAATVREFKSITVSGKIPLEHFHELFQCFVAPFAPNGNKAEIQVSFKIASTENSPLTESKQQYKNAREAAKQLGPNRSEEIK